MADTDSVLYGQAPAPAPPAPPAPPANALDTTPGADPTIAAANASKVDPLAEATRLGGPLGGVALGALSGAHKEENADTANTAPAPAANFNPTTPPGVKSVKDIMADPKFLNLTPGAQKIILTQKDPKFAALSEGAKTAVLMHLNQGGRGAAAISNPEDIGTGPEGTTDIDKLMSPASQADASKKGGMLAGVMAGGVAAPLAAAAVGGGALGAAAGGAAAGGANAITEQAATGQNPISPESVKDTAIQTGLGLVGGAALHKAGELYSPIRNWAADQLEMWSPKAPVVEQGLKNEIAGVLGKKTDATIAQDAYDLLENKVPRSNSDIENELKLVKPKVDARIAQNNAMIDGILNTGPQPPIKNAAAQVSRFFDDMADAAASSQSTTRLQEATAIRNVKNVVVPAMQDEMSPLEVNNLRKNIDAHIKTWDPKTPLTGPAKQGQEAYRMARFKLADMVKDAQPDTAPLFDRWHNDINLNELLESKFNDMTTPEQFMNSYQSFRSQAQKARVGALLKTTARRGMYGLGMAEGYHLLNPFGH